MYVPPFIYLLFEIPIYLLTLIVLWTAFRESRFLGLVLIAAIGCGFFIEWFNLKESGSYFYERFLVMLASAPYWVPLCICTAWACLLYSTTQTTDALPLPWWQRPAVDGLFAVIIDFVLDPVAASSRLVPKPGDFCDKSFPEGAADGLGFWTWCVPPESEAFWFGVPIGNFYGWMVVIFSLSMGMRLALRWLLPEKRDLPYQIMATLVAAALAIIFTYLLLALYLLLHMWLGVSEWILIGVALAIPIVFLLLAWPSIVRNRPPNWVALGMPALTGLFCLIAFFLGGLYKTGGIKMLAMIVLFTILGVFLFALPYKRPLGNAP